MMYCKGLIDEAEDIDLRSAFNMMAKSEMMRNKKKRLTTPDPYEALQVSCSLMDEGVVGVFLSASRENSQTVQSVCDVKEIPLIDLRWNERISRNCNVINLYPYAPSLSKAYADIIKFWNWEAFTVLYESNDGLSRISEILKMNHRYPIVVKQLLTTSPGNYRSALKEVWRSDHTHFVLDCHIDNLETILQQAQQIGLITKIYSYIVTNLDFHTINLEPYKYSEAKITGVNMKLISSPKIINFDLF